MRDVISAPAQRRAAHGRCLTGSGQLELDLGSVNTCVMLESASRYLQGRAWTVHLQQSIGRGLLSLDVGKKIYIWMSIVISWLPLSFHVLLNEKKVSCFLLKQDF